MLHNPLATKQNSMKTTINLIAKKTIEPVHIGLEDEKRESVVHILARVLADQHVLYIKKRNFHWNLKGPRFHTLHEFFEKQYVEIEAAIDRTAERLRTIGGVAPGSMKEFLDLASLKEASGDLIDGDDCIVALIADHEACARNVREAIAKVEEEYGDVGTADFLTELLQGHEEMAWMLRSFLDLA